MGSVGLNPLSILAHITYPWASSTKRHVSRHAEGPNYSRLLGVSRKREVSLFVCRVKKAKVNPEKWHRDLH